MNASYQASLVNRHIRRFTGNTGNEDSGKFVGVMSHGLR